MTSYQSWLHDHGTKRRASPPARKLVRFKLRTLFILIAVVAVCLHLFLAPRWKRHRVEQITLSSGGSLAYFHQCTPEGFDVTITPPGPAWLRAVLGQNFFAELTEVHLANPTQEEFDQIALLDCFSSLVVESRTSAIHSLAALDHSRQIQDLHLIGEMWTDDHIKTLDAERVSFKMLGFHRTQHTDAILKRVAEMPHLEHIELRYTKISGEGLSQLKELKSLRVLSLMGTGFDRSALTSLPELTQIETLWLSDVDRALFTKELTSLQKSLPNCTIIWY